MEQNKTCKNISNIKVNCMHLLAVVKTGSLMTLLFVVSLFPCVPKIVNPPVTIFAGGDIMLGRYVETLMNRNGDDYAFSAIKSHLQNFDIVMANLEGPIMTNHRQTADFTTNFSFKPETANTLKRNGINLVTIANNHLLDKGPMGYTQTQEYLDQAGIAHFGHPKQVDDQYVLYKEINGYQLAFLGFHNATTSLDNEKVIAQIKKIETDDTVDLIIVNIHWGIEYKPINNVAQQQLAHQMIDAGADAIIGHHPHVVQNIEVYKDKAIFYSLGNLVFDQYFSKETQEGLTLKIKISDSAIDYELVPVSIVKSQPQIMSPEETIIWLKDLALRSDSTLAGQLERGIITLQY